MFFEGWRQWPATKDKFKMHSGMKNKQLPLKLACTGNLVYHQGRSNVAVVDPVAKFVVGLYDVFRYSMCRYRNQSR